MVCSFFAEVEKCVHAVLPKHLVHGESDKASLKKSLFNVIVKNENIQFYWTVLSQNIENPDNSTNSYCPFAGDNLKVFHGCLMDGGVQEYY